MLNCIRKLLGIRKKYEIDEQDTEITKLYNAVVVARNELAHAKKRWRENQAHITCLRKTIHDLAKELKETKRLLSREKKYSDSSVSLDTDIIIDAQNELQAYERDTRELRAHYASTNLRMQHSERCKAHLQTACAQAQNIAVQTFQQFQQNRGMNGADNEPENAAA